jgi:hypothetical protein
MAWALAAADAAEEEAAAAEGEGWEGGADEEEGTRSGLLSSILLSCLHNYQRCLL